MTDDPQDLGVRFVRAIAEKDEPALRALFADACDFRGLTPGDTWRATTPAEIAEVVFGSWFEPFDRVQEVLESDCEPLLERSRLRYRFRVDSDGTPCLVEQEGYYTVEDGRITRMSVVCSGYQELEG